MNIRLIPALFLFILTTCNTAWCAPITVCVAEFNVSGIVKPEEMKATIQALLLSRMASEKIVTVSKPEGADIKISGSYLLSGNMFSLDAAATNSAGTVVTRAFTQGKNPDDLIPAVSTLAKSLSDGIDKALPSKAQPAAPQPTDMIIRPQKVSARQLALFKMDGALKGLAVGRTFPGGDRELFVIGSHTLRYYRQDTELKMLAEINYETYDNLLAVDTAYLDNDKVPEIYVTIMRGEALVSQVWTLDGTSLKQIAGPLPYYFRALTSEGGVKKLYAQQISDRDDFHGPVAEVVKSGQSYRLANPVKLPKPGYLYDFNIVKGLKSELDYVVIDRDRYLKILNPAGDVLWKSNEEFSGSETYFARAEAVSQQGSEEGYRKVYLDQRIIIKANGELLVPKNSESWYMLNKHSYSRSSIYCFVWDGVNLEEKWHTGETDNYLADFAYDDVSHELLLLEVVGKCEGLFASAASRLVIKKID